jgi:DNA-binding HxlR family transcriptional regulator
VGSTNSTHHPAAPARRIIELLAKERSMEVLHALTGAPMQPSQLEARLDIAHSTLHVCLKELLDAGLLCERELQRLPLQMEYALTDAARTAVTGVILTRRLQMRTLGHGEPETGERLGDLLRLLAPLVSLPERVQGTCAALELLSGNRRPARVWLLACDGCLQAQTPGKPSSRPAASVSGEPAAWDELLLAGSVDGLQIEQDHALAQTVLVALGEILR